MELSWMGRYRELVRALIYYSNTSNRGTAVSMARVGEISLSKMEYQILEYICEFENENRIMTDISRDLGILQSNVTKATKHLLTYGLAERYHMKGNKKSIVLKPTEAGKEIYAQYYARDVQPIFQPFFDFLDQCSDEQLRQFETAVRILSCDWQIYSDSLLEKIDE